jgi:hypothetical protein
VFFDVNKNGTNQLITTAGSSKLVTFSNEITDTANAFASNRFTAKHNGYYDAIFHCSFNAAPATGVCNAQIQKNGTTVGSAQKQLSTTDPTPFSIVIISAWLSIGDYLEAYVFQNCGSSVNLSGATSFTYFSGHIVKEI